MPDLNWKVSAIFQTHCTFVKSKGITFEKDSKSVKGRHIIACFPRTKHQKKIFLEIHYVCHRSGAVEADKGMADSMPDID